jgi:hypothetical protein
MANDGKCDPAVSIRGKPQQQQPEQVQSTMDQLQVAASGVEQQEDEQQDRKLSPNEFGRHKKDSGDK